MIAKPLIPLEFLEQGEWAEVVAVHAEPSWVARLAEMGLRPGVRLCVLQSGSPCLFRLGEGGESRMSLRLHHAGQLLVQPVETPTSEAMACLS